MQKKQPFDKKQHKQKGSNNKDVLSSDSDFESPPWNDRRIDGSRPSTDVGQGKGKRREIEKPNEKKYKHGCHQNQYLPEIYVDSCFFIVL